MNDNQHSRNPAPRWPTAACISPIGGLRPKPPTWMKSELARRLRSMMSPSKEGILLLSLVTREDEDSLERRRLTNLAAILRDPFYTVTSKIISGNHWVGEIRENLLPGDLLVCLNGHKRSCQNLKRKPVGQALADQLPYPVYVSAPYSINEVLQPGNKPSNFGMGGSYCYRSWSFWDLMCGLSRMPMAGSAALLLWVCVLLVEAGLICGLE